MDFTAHLGGPIVKNRAWFFGGGQVVRDFDSRPGANPATPFERRSEKVFAKVTWNATDSLKFTHSVHRSGVRQPSTPFTAAIPEDVAYSVKLSNYSVTYAQVNHILSDSTFWELRVSGSPQNGTGTPNSGYDKKVKFDLATGLYCCGSYGFLSAEYRQAGDFPEDQPLCPRVYRGRSI